MEMSSPTVTSRQRRSFDAVHYANHNSSNARIELSVRQQQTSPASIHCPLRSNADPRAENEYTIWLESQLHRS
ncbi:unnamed protein product [Adineta ricciae]|uniref:Uncharacterized protein n=1 Tax=Adineta ricciae TaxID=249248 RepID=A0A814SHP2_ADIRI|nr:unnamed protein product [Adineta ricciae]